jgi:hypothetical protein
LVHDFILHKKGRRHVTGNNKGEAIMAQSKSSGAGIDISANKSVNKLRSKAVGLVGVIFLAVTGAAPMSAMLGNVPFAAGYGIGTYTPGAFLLATIVLTIFSIGYAAMASRVSSVGGSTPSFRKALAARLVCQRASRRLPVIQFLKRR